MKRTSVCFSMKSSDSLSGVQKRALGKGRSLGFGLLFLAAVGCATRHDNAPQAFIDAQSEMERSKDLRTAAVFPKTMERAEDKYDRAGDLYEEALGTDDAVMKEAKISEASTLAEEAHQMSKSANNLAFDIPNWDEDIFAVERNATNTAEAEVMQGQISGLQSENKLLNERLTSSTDLASSPLARVQDLRFNGSVAFFDVNSSDLQAPFHSSLDEIAETVRQSGSFKVKVMGYADPTGSIELNDQLSLARAESVKSYLESKGVSNSQIQVEAFGDRQPLGPITSSGRLQLERRVDIQVEAVR